MGIPTKRFIAASSIPSLFVCKVCNGVADDPRQSPCCKEIFCNKCVPTKYFCKYCREYKMLTVPPPALLSQMNKLVVTCENYERGCRDLIRLGDLSSHVCHLATEASPKTKVSADTAPQPPSLISTVFNTCTFDGHPSFVQQQQQDAPSYGSRMQTISPQPSLLSSSPGDLMSTKLFSTRIGTPNQPNYPVLFSELNTLSATRLPLQSPSTVDLQSTTKTPGANDTFQQDIHSKKVSMKRVRDETFSELQEIEQQLQRFQRKLQCPPTASSTPELAEEVASDEFQVVTNSPLPEPSHQQAARVSSVDSAQDSSVPPQDRFDATETTYSSDQDGDEDFEQQILDSKLSPKGWYQMADMPDGRHACSAVVYNNDIIVVGGIGTQGTLSSVAQFSTSTQEWHYQIPALSVPRGWCAVVTGLDRLFVIGGSNGVGHTHQSAEMYDFLCNTWCVLPSMNSARESCAAVMVGKQIFVFGGFNQTEVLDSVEVFDLETLCWTSIAPMQQRRGACCAVYSDTTNQIFVIGGTDGIAALSSVEVFDLDTYTWNVGTPLLQSRIACSAVCIGQEIIVAGGGNSLELLSSVESFSAQGKHIVLPSMNFSRLGCSAVNLDGRMVVLGGRSSNDLKLSVAEMLIL